MPAEQVVLSSFPGCFYAFYSELGWRFPLRNLANPYRWWILNAGQFRFVRDDGSIHNGVDFIRQNPPNVSYPPNPPYTYLTVPWGSSNGERIYAVHGGTVLASQWYGSGGWMIAVQSNIRHPVTNNFIISRYMHMRERSGIESEAMISPGRLIGHVGDTGNATSGGHLHLEFNIGRSIDGLGLNRNYFIHPVRFFANIDIRNSQPRYRTIWPY